jgi:hypothetical protein
MKKVLFCLMLLCSLTLSAQEAKSPIYAKVVDGMLQLSNVENVPNTNAPELYKRALKWVSVTYKNPKSVIQTQDESAGILVIKGIANIDKSQYEHKLTFEFKDNKYRWTISDCYIIYPSFFNLPNKKIEEIPRYSKEDCLEILNNDFADYIKSFQKGLSESDNW